MKERRAVGVLAEIGGPTYTFFVLGNGKIVYTSNYRDGSPAFGSIDRRIPEHCKTFAEYFDTVEQWWASFKNKLSWTILPDATEEEKVEMLLMKLRTGL